MTNVKREEPVLQWHPAFFAGLQIELSAEKEKVSFESEHQLGTKPMLIDVLIVKKNSDEPMEKNIGRIFRKYNIVEYKSPKDYLSIDDFYKVYGYACFYKADVTSVDSLKVDEITLTFVCKGYPRNLIQHLTEVRGFEVELFESGIYYIKGDIFTMQLIVTSQLLKEENFWLKNLTDNLPDRDAVEELAKEYHEHRKNTLYRSVMDVIVRANEELFKEESDMCDAIIDLFRDEYDKGVEEARQMGVQQGIDSFVLEYLEDGFEVESIIQKLMRRFSMTRELAEDTINRLKDRR